MRTSCDVCGAENQATRRALIVWREPVTLGHFDTGERCVNVELCRARVDASGEAWPLLEPGELLEDAS